VGNAGNFHAWNVAELTTGVGNWGGTFTAGQTGWKAGDANYGVGTPGNIESIVTVASHRSAFLMPNGMPYGGEISSYSSRGNIINGRQKPDLSAPGQSIVAALSSFTDGYTGIYSASTEFNGRTYRFVALSGTSMSSPFVAGVVALMLQANPYLTPVQVREILMETARQDEYTEESGTVRFGAGKVDAQAAVKKALEYTGIHDFQPVNFQLHIYPNPASQTLYITSTSSFNNLEMKVCDLSGRVIAQQNVNSGVTILDVAAYAPGCYLLKISDGKEIIVKKWIKH
jgi:subtilisin family serine protease